MKIEQVAEGITRVESGASGPTVAIVGGTHGDEKTGIQVVRDLTRDFGQGVFKLARGVLYLVLANLKAIQEGARFSAGGVDLNRCFAEAVLAQPGERPIYEHRRANEIACFASEIDIVGIDIHATTKPSEPFVVCQRSPTAEDERVYRWFGARHIVTDPNWVFAGQRVTLDEYFARYGGVGLCYETGFASDTSRLEEVKTEIMNILYDLGLLHAKSGEAKYRSVRPCQQQVLELTTAIMHPGAGYRWRAGVAERNFQPVAREPACLFVPPWISLDDEAGELGPVTISPEGHVIVFPKPESRWELGKPVAYLARKV